MIHPLYPCLWFDGKAKEAASFYCTVFSNSNILSENPIVTMFELEGQKFMGLNGGDMFKPNPSISFFVVMQTKEEINAAWEKLSEGGMVMMPLDKYPWSEWYGFLSDPYGVCWQLYLGDPQQVGQKICPSFMFVNEQNGKAEAAMKFYTSLFENSRIGGIARYEKGEPDVEGNVKHAQFLLGSQVFMAMDSSAQHQFKFNEGISLVAACDTQEEIDYLWEKLTEKGQESMCGWLKDPYGVSWQIVPSVLPSLMSDPTRADRVMQAFLKMKKFNIQQLLKA